MDYKFTWSTVSFYCRDEYGKVTYISPKMEHLIPDKVFREAVNKAGEWVNDE